MRPTPRRSIDLNCDLGEGLPHDAALMPLVSSVNVACGEHAGDASVMRDTVALAIRHGVAIGAHPGHADRPHFGRRTVPITPAAAVHLVVRQVERLADVAGGPPRHLKLHGGLYHQAAQDPSLAAALAAAVAARWPRMLVVGSAGSCLLAAARDRRLAVVEEAFADRMYRADGSLVPRSASAATIDDPAAAANQAVWIALDGRAMAVDGGTIAVPAATLCIHGDGPDPIAIARAVRAALARSGIGIAPPVPDRSG